MIDGRYTGSHRIDLRGASVNDGILTFPIPTLVKGVHNFESFIITIRTDTYIMAKSANRVIEVRNNVNGKMNVYLGDVNIYSLTDFKFDDTTETLKINHTPTDIVSMLDKAKILEIHNDTPFYIVIEQLDENKIYLPYDVYGYSEDDDNDDYTFEYTMEMIDDKVLLYYNRPQKIRQAISVSMVSGVFTLNFIGGRKSNFKIVKSYE